ncbi:S-adenosyl-L-methionine-dependent methyltransferase [Aspergillus caelatus]|uniref:S-adenosyl-L-methionine-dependent methyltransferase n=1 Tax=Aspergillus caelatus TaxID=61420 RepID=A0A5N7ACC0_9EURO|nr:S-adenosyl-L-methionine-dependent methyltransferase [Aspergillus caelatus]KAE8366796.1 S-adenosyl-L-methionine-dependent methyltransferase [Aspergillus caelatus]
MESIIAQARFLAGEADGAGRAKIRDALRQFLLELETPKDLLMGIFNNHLQIGAVRLGIESGLFRSFSQSEIPLQVDQVAEKTGASPQLFECILRYLASNGFVIEADHGKFKANKATHTLASQMAEAFIYHAFDNCGPAIQEFPSFFAETRYQEITTNTNTPFQKAFHTDLTCFAWLAQRPERFNALQHVMTALESTDWAVGFSRFEKEACAIIRRPQDSRRSFLVDVGGGHGHQCIQLIQKYPNLSGWLILQDLPQAVDQLPKIDGVETMAYDIFQTQVVKGKSCIYTQNNCPSITPSPTDIQTNPQGAKFYYLRRILHAYPDSQGIQILRNLRTAMAHDSQILIDEMVLSETNVPWQATLADLSLMVSMGGKERSKKQWEMLAEQSDLRVAEFHTYDNSDNFSVIVMELR